MFRFIESRNSYDLYQTEYNGRTYVIQYNPRMDRIEQMRPISDGSSGTVELLFESFITQHASEVDSSEHQQMKREE